MFRLRELRTEKEMTQEQLAGILGVSKQTVSRWEKEINFPEQKHLIQLAQIFDCSIDYIMGNASNKNGIIVNENWNGHPAKIEVDRINYPGGLTHEQAIEALEAMDKLGLLDKFKK